MIRGCIESVSPRLVRGWIHADGRSVRDLPLLAFVGKDCIGSGQVGQFRQDLADAGLGDGYLGFEIPIAGERAEDLAAVVVRLESSDAVLVQSHARLVGDAPQRLMDPELMRREMTHYRFMLAQGWIDQTDYDFLKGVTRRGWYEQALPKAQRESAAAIESGIATMARRALSVLHRRDVTLEQTPVSSLQGLIDALQRLPDSEERPVVALHGASFTLRLSEASHLSDSPDASGVMAMDVSVSRHQLLFVDARCRLHELTTAGDAPVQMLSALAFSQA